LILSFALCGLIFFILTIQELLFLIQRFKDTKRIRLFSKITLDAFERLRRLFRAIFAFQ
jgi:hypothetical protein